MCCPWRLASTAAVAFLVVRVKVPGTAGTDPVLAFVGRLECSERLGGFGCPRRSHPALEHDAVLSAIRVVVFRTAPEWRILALRLAGSRPGQALGARDGLNALQLGLDPTDVSAIATLMKHLTRHWIDMAAFQGHFQLFLKLFLGRH